MNAIEWARQLAILCLMSEKEENECRHTEIYGVTGVSLPSTTDN